MLILLGGSFDPIHSGHLHIAKSLQKRFPEAEICFLPCKKPVIEKQLQSNAEDRVRMLEYAIEEHPTWCVDLRELNRDTPSYTWDTFVSFREQTHYQNQPIAFVMGSDVFSKLDQEWGKHWRELITQAHIIVIERAAEIQLSSPQLQEWFLKNQEENYEKLNYISSGKVCKMDVQAPCISSTEIREALKNGQIPENLPARVLKYIKKKGLYGYVSSSSSACRSVVKV